MSSHARNKLNVKQVGAISRVGVYADGGGLYLRVRKSGRSWIFIGTLDRKRLELGLGAFHDLSLAKAREKAAATRALVLDGIDPRQPRPKAAPVALAAPAAPVVTTFGKFALQLVSDIGDGFKNSKHRQQWKNTLTTYAAPLFEVPITDVATDDVVAVLQPIWLSKPETASRLRGRIERVLDAAKVKGLRSGDNPARGRGHLDLLLPKRRKNQVKHHAALAFAKVPAFMSQLQSRPAVAARALEFTILTAARSGEVRGMTWSEINFTDKLWTVPGSRMKAGTTHQVPLSDTAVAVLRGFYDDGPGSDGVVFPAPRGGELSDMALSQLLKRMGYAGITVHGFRSAFRDWAGEITEFGREEVELALAHTIASTTERAYRRGRALDKRRVLMEAWADYLCGADQASGSSTATAKE